MGCFDTSRIYVRRQGASEIVNANSSPLDELISSMKKQTKPPFFNQVLIDNEAWMEVIKHTAMFNCSPVFEMGKIGRKRAALRAYYADDGKSFFTCVDSLLEAVNLLRELPSRISGSRISVAKESFLGKFDKEIRIQISEFLPSTLTKDDCIELTKEGSRITSGLRKRAVQGVREFRVSRSIKAKGCKIKIVSYPLRYDVVKKYDLGDRDDRVSVAIKKMKLAEAMKKTP